MLVALLAFHGRAAGVAALTALRRRTLDLTALTILALLIATAMASGRRWALMVTILVARRRTLELAVLLVLTLARSTTVPPRRGRRAIPLDVVGIVRALWMVTHTRRRPVVRTTWAARRRALELAALTLRRRRWLAALGAVIAVRAVVAVVHERRRPLLVVVVVDLWSALLERWRRPRALSAGLLRGGGQRREAECQRRCCDYFFHGVTPYHYSTIALTVGASRDAVNKTVAAMEIKSDY